MQALAQASAPSTVTTSSALTAPFLVVLVAGEWPGALTAPPATTPRRALTAPFRVVLVAGDRPGALGHEGPH